MVSDKKMSEATKSLVDLVKTSIVIEPRKTNIKPIEIYDLNTEGNYELIKDVENKYNK